MVVQHNLTAMNSNRMLGLTTASQAKSTEKLSSGYKINRAADDAAGLSISEKMRKQIRGLSQASLNAEDGISAVQTAEGALNEVQDMLQRINELAVKAANGTMSENDRNYIQNEVDQLVTEIDRVSETTKFNETYLLKGDKDVTDYSIKYATTGGTPEVPGTPASMTFVATAYVSDGAGNYTEVTAVNMNTLFSVADDGTVTLNSGTLVTADDGSDVAANIADVVTGTPEVPGTPAVPGTAAQYYDAYGNKIAANGLLNYFEVTAEDDGAGNITTTITQKDGAVVYDAEGNVVANAADALAAEAKTGALMLTLHVGADATENNQISVAIDAMSAEGLGIVNDDGKLLVNGKTDDNALAAIDTIKEAIQLVSTQRSALGAVQNRLEHTIANLDNVVENTTAAESQIRDTDMATEMVRYSNNNILAQAGQAMLAQANQANQGVLSLLQ